MKDDHFGDWFWIVVYAGLTLILAFNTGCASVPSMAITEADIDAKLEALSNAVPKDPEAVVYNETTGKYEMKPEPYKKAVGMGAVKELQDDKISAMVKYLAEHPPATFRDKLRWAGWGAVILLILETAAYFAGGGFDN